MDKYLPSNGTEGECFFESWCRHCQRDRAMRDGEPIFSELATHIEMQDEAAGAFVELIQIGKIGEAGRNVVRIDADEWPAIRGAIDQMLGLIDSLDLRAAAVACDQMIETLDRIGDADRREG